MDWNPNTQRPWLNVFRNGRGHACPTYPKPATLLGCQTGATRSDITSSAIRLNGMQTTRSDKTLMTKVTLAWELKTH